MDPTIYVGTICGSPIFGSSHIVVSQNSLLHVSCLLFKTECKCSTIAYQCKSAAEVQAYNSEQASEDFTESNICD